MHIALTLFIVLSLLLVIYQDFRYRAVSWFMFPVILTGGIALILYFTSTVQLIKYSLINMSIVLFQIAGLTLYFSVRNHQWTNITRRYLGWGDVLFLFCISPLFSPVNFILFIIAASILTLIVTLLANLFSKKAYATIPLAGALSMVLIPLMLQLLWKNHYTIYNDILFSQFLIING